MSYLRFIVPLVLLTSCHDNQTSTINSAQPATSDTVSKHDMVPYNPNDWQEGFGLTHDPEVDSIWGKSVKFYIGNPKCSPIAIGFYQDHFRPADDDSTAALLSLVTTNDIQLRPFYRWCLNKTIQIQDGALAEYTGVPARQYAEKFPKEFFEYMDFDSTGEKYGDWVSAILYSGYYHEDDAKKPHEVRKRMTLTMKGNCISCSAQLNRRIDKFAEDCFR